MNEVALRRFSDRKGRLSESGCYSVGIEIPVTSHTISFVLLVFFIDVEDGSSRDLRPDPRDFDFDCDPANHRARVREKSCDRHDNRIPPQSYPLFISVLFSSTRHFDTHLAIAAHCSFALTYCRVI